MNEFANMIAANANALQAQKVAQAQLNKQL